MIKHAHGHDHQHELLFLPTNFHRKKVVEVGAAFESAVVIESAEKEV